MVSAGAARAAEPAAGLRGAARRLRRGRRGAPGRRRNDRLARRDGGCARHHGCEHAARRSRTGLGGAPRLGVPRRWAHRLRALLHPRQGPARLAASARQPGQLPARTSPARVCVGARRARALRLLADPDRGLRPGPLPVRRLGRRHDRNRLRVDLLRVPRVGARAARDRRAHRARLDLGPLGRRRRRHDRLSRRG